MGHYQFTVSPQCRLDTLAEMFRRPAAVIPRTVVPETRRAELLLDWAGIRQRAVLVESHSLIFGGLFAVLVKPTEEATPGTLPTLVIRNDSGTALATWRYELVRVGGMYAALVHLGAGEALGLFHP